jgi:hypothetical protein
MRVAICVAFVLVSAIASSAAAQWTTTTRPQWNGYADHQVTGPGGYSAEGRTIPQWRGYSTTYWRDNKGQSHICRTIPQFDGYAQTQCN